MRKVLVTGGTGFIGSHPVEMLVRSGFQVKVFDRYNPSNNWGWLEDSRLKGDFEVVLGDIRDFDSVSKSIKSMDVVLHLAALIGIPYSYESPLAYIRTNIEGTYNVLEACKTYETNDLIVTSTSETYGTASYIPIDEGHPKVGQSPYSASKIAADQLALSYFRSFNLPVKILRPFNTYGPRQSSRAIIPTIITQILSGKRELALGNLNPTRDLTFVTDTCKSFTEILNNPNFIGQEINVGMNEEISIKDLSTLLANLLNVEVKLKIEKVRVRPDLSEVDRLRCDNSKLIKETNWLPEFSLKQGLKETIDWFSKEENLKLYKSSIYNV